MDKKDSKILATLSIIGLFSVALSLKFLDTESVILVFFSLYVGLNTLCYFLINKKKEQVGFIFSLLNTVQLNLSLTLPLLLKLPLSEALTAVPVLFTVFFSLCMAVAAFQTNFSRKKPKESVISQEDEFATPLYQTPDVLMQPKNLLAEVSTNLKPMPSQSNLRKPMWVYPLILVLVLIMLLIPLHDELGPHSYFSIF